MARSRNIKPGFFANEHLATLPFETRLLSIGLWTLADREGRLEDRPIRIKMQLFGADDLDVVDCLNQLADAGEPFIVRYVVNGSAFIEIVNFSKHQRPHKNEPAIYPPYSTSDQNPIESDQTPNNSHQGAKRGKEGISKQESANGNPSRGIQETGISNQNAESESPSTTPDDVFGYYIASKATTKPRTLTTARRQKLLTRLRESNWPWRDAIDKLPIPNDKAFTFQPDLDWLIENDTNARKVAEGRYDRSGPQARTKNNLAAVEAFAHGQ